MPWVQSYRQNGTDIVKHTFTFVANGGGSVSQASGLPVSGEIQRVVIVPGTPTPTALYDLTLTDSDGVDVLAGQGANVAAGNVNICPGTPLKDGTTTGVLPMVVDSVLTLNVTNAGAGGAGSVIVYVR